MQRRKTTRARPKSLRTKRERTKSSRTSSRGRNQRREEVRFFTAGYEGVAVENFVHRLRAEAIACVIDVRELPLSRKRGFSKHQLRAHLAEAGIRYENYPQLGAPPALRHRYRAGGSRAEFARGFAALLPQRREAIARLLEQSRAERICLLCFERDPAACHRSIVAAEMERFSPGGVHRVEHLRFAPAEE